MLTYYVIHFDEKKCTYTERVCDVSEIQWRKLRIMTYFREETPEFEAIILHHRVGHTRYIYVNHRLFMVNGNKDPYYLDLHRSEAEQLLKDFLSNHP
jgi:hypothetical protein